jgi:hypothetical protein
VRRSDVREEFFVTENVGGRAIVEEDPGRVNLVVGLVEVEFFLVIVAVGGGFLGDNRCSRPFFRLFLLFLFFFLFFFLLSLGLFVGEIV